MDDCDNNFHINDNFYNSVPFPHNGNDNLYFNNFPNNFSNDYSILGNRDDFDSNNVFVKIHTDIHHNYPGHYKNFHEIKPEPIKSEVNEVNQSSSTTSQINQINSKLSNITKNSCDNGQSSFILENSIINSLRCYKCENCPYISISEAKLEKHVSEFHSDTEETAFANKNRFHKLACPGCENIFYVSTVLENHLEKDHQMEKDDVGKVVEYVLSKVKNAQLDNSAKKSRIYLKNVDCLRNPPISERFDEVPDNDLVLIDLVDDNREEERNLNPAQNKISIKSVDVLCEPAPLILNQNENFGFNLCNASNTYNELNPICIDNYQSSERNQRFQTQTSIEKKIYIKNVDILKEPIFVPPQNFTNVLNVHDDLSFNSLFPPSNDVGQQYTTLPSLPFSSDIDYNEDCLNRHRNKIYIKDALSLNQSNFPEIHKKPTNSLHLRTVDELNLMNKNEVQNLITPNLDQNTTNQAVTNQSSENSKNSDEMGMAGYRTLPPELLNYNTQDNNFVENDNEIIQPSWSHDYGFDGLENIIDSSSSPVCPEQKNPHFELNTPQRSINEENDQDILFVCAEEIINSGQNNPTKESADVEKSKEDDMDFCEISTLSPIEEQEVDEILDDLEIKEKGKIYVSDSLLQEPYVVSDDEVKKRPRGRPVGAKQTGITKLKKLHGTLTPAEIGFKCDLDCGLRFRKIATLEFHKSCHVSGPTRIQCPTCKSTEFSSWNTLHTHLWRCHKINMELYSCDYCDFKTPIQSRLLNTHIKIHQDEKHYTCSECGKAFKNSKQLKNHRTIHREQVIRETHRCEKCGSVFSHLKSLKEHNCKQDEDNNKNLSCNICSKVISSKSALKLHLLTHEASVTRFQCTSCEYSTNDHNTFRRHKMTHDKDKMYTCPFCGYKCIQSNLYQRHILSKHPNVANQVIFKCLICSFSTINRAKYNIHTVKHGLALSASSQDDQNESTPINGEITRESFAGTKAQLQSSNKIKLESEHVLADPSKFGSAKSALPQKTEDGVT